MNAEAGRRVAYGAAIFLVGVVQFLLGIAVTALRFGPRAYSPLRNTVSDLQAVHCGMVRGNEVCSPLHVVANSSVAVLGLSMIAGSILIRTAFPAGPKRMMAIGLMVVAGFAVFVNAFTPEDVTLTGDIVTALVAFLCANFGLIQMGRAMSDGRERRRFRLLSELLGTVGLVGLVVSGAGVPGPLGAGGNEWLIVAPFLIWSFLVGTILTRPRD